MSAPFRCLGTGCLLSIALLVPLPLFADDLGADPEFADGLTADDIYASVLENRFETAAQELLLKSGDRAGREQAIRMQMLWKSYETAESQGVQSRTVVRYMELVELRRTGYLIVNKLDEPSDQFVYLTSMRRIRRVNLRGETVVGTDLSLEGVVQREMDDAIYARIPDETIEGTDCFVVEATPKAEAKSDYSKFRLYAEKGHYVPLRIRYWDRAAVEIKELRSPIDSIREFQGVYVPIRSTMRHLLDETYTDLKIDMLVANPDLPNRYFTQRQLESKKLRLPDDVARAARHP